MSQKSLFEQDLITCPRCDFTDELDQFDIMGSCDDNIFCPMCNCEFDSTTGIKHDARSCEFCVMRRQRQEPYMTAEIIHEVQQRRAERARVLDLVAEQRKKEIDEAF